MARALKTQKSNTVDTGFPWQDLYNIGVVGGNTSLTGAQIKVRVKFIGDSEADGYIIRQKGAKKFLVTDAASVSAGAFVTGDSYMITAAGTTNFQSIGADASYAVGTIFTATGAGTGTGTAIKVGTCKLVDRADTALADADITGEDGLTDSNVDGSMTVTVTETDSGNIRLARLSNRWGEGFDGIRRALSFTDFADSAVGTAAETIKSGTKEDYVEVVQVDNDYTWG
jgi:hypothetical protein